MEIMDSELLLIVNDFYQKQKNGTQTHLTGTAADAEEHHCCRVERVERVGWGVQKRNCKMMP